MRRKPPKYLRGDVVEIQKPPKYLRGDVVEIQLTAYTMHFYGDKIIGRVGVVIKAIWRDRYDVYVSHINERINVGAWVLKLISRHGQEIKSDNRSVQTEAP